MWIISQKGKWCPGHLSLRKHYADCGGQWRCMLRPGCWWLWSIIAKPLTTSVSVLHSVSCELALGDPNKNPSGTLPCFATLISPLNLGPGQVRMLLVSLATETRITFELHHSVKWNIFHELWSTDRNICWQEIFWWTWIQIFLPCHVTILVKYE